ncbi:MAG: hypothetical protein PHW82_12950 [Bacteroidales bacterium]|nr:hypothetical protein [Bacteroidales bacterium]
MTEQGALLQLMIKNEMKKHKGFEFSISNHVYDSPKIIKLMPDEIVFISFIAIDANSDFIMNYCSADEVRTIKRVIASQTIVEDNIISEHHSSISFNMSNSDKYRVSIIKLKIIK